MCIIIQQKGMAKHMYVVATMVEVLTHCFLGAHVHSCPVDNQFLSQSFLAGKCTLCLLGFLCK